MELKKLPDSQIELEIEVSAEELDHHYKHALEHAREHVQADGFRKGNAPNSIVESRIGSEHLLADAADFAVKDAYSKAIKEHGLEPIGHPEIQILKLAKGNPFLFKLKVSVLPDVKLPDYKKIAEKAERQKVSVSEDEIENTLNYVRKSRAKFTASNKPAELKDFIEIEYESPQIISSGRTKDQFALGEGGFVKGFEENIIGMNNGEEKEFKVPFPKDYIKKDLAGKDVQFKLKVLSIQNVELPELTDEFAKSLGKFDNLDAVRKNIKDGLTLEKEAESRQKTRLYILDSIAKDSKVQIPQPLVDFEKNNLFNAFKDKITHDHNVLWEKYLESVKQNDQSLKETFNKEAERKVKSFLILREIGKKENIFVADEELEKEVNQTLRRYPKEAAEKIDIQELKEYTKGVIYNEKVFLKLESFIK